MSLTRALLLFMALCTALSARAQEAPWAIGWDALHRLDLLPAYKRSVTIGAVTSYDRTEGNDDGFSGKYSFVRKEGDDLVLAELTGPGCVYRIHTPTPTDDPLEFYFDGEATPRLRTTFRELFSGSRPPFVRPLVEGAGGGYYSYVPLPYRRSLKIVLRAKSFQFYDLNFATYPADAPVTSFTPSVGDTDRRAIERATTLFRGGDLSALAVPEGTKLTRQAFSVRLEPGKSATLWEGKRPGRIASLKIGPTDALAGKERDLWLRVTWDGAREPAILCPAGDFFGYAWGKPSAAGALIGSRDGMAYCNLPMPFDKSARIELVSLRESGPAVAVRGEVVVGETGRRPYEGRFYALWHRENPTTDGKPFTFVETRGRGHLVGLALQSQGRDPGNTFFFEGDDQTTIDGKLVVHGTGSEDFFNGGWYDVPGRWDRALSLPLSGCLAYQRHLSRTGAYRFFLGDCYSFGSSLLQTIEHGPEKNALITDYASVAYLYSEHPPTVARTIPDRAGRAVADPTAIVFTPHWTLPISSFAFASATVSRTDVPAGERPTRALSLRAKGPDFFGPPFIGFLCDIPAAGRYRVFADVVKGPACGKVQLFLNGAPAGEVVDLYAEKPTLVKRVPLGEIDAIEGANDLMFQLVDRNPAASGLGLDLVEIVCERVR